MSKQASPKLRVAVVTCYDQADYVRARVLRTAFGAQPGVELTVLKNRRKGIGRYPEMMWRVLVTRFRWRPDVYVVTFRGYEILLYMLLSGVRKPIIFDELVSFVGYYHEHDRLREGSLADRLLRRFYGWQLRRCRLILADTQASAEYSAQLCSVPLDKYRVVPVSTDEVQFHPEPGPRHTHKPFTVFYYGNVVTSQGLHGFQYVLAAAVLLKDRKDVQFILAAGGKDGALVCADAVQQGAHVTHVPWMEQHELVQATHSAGLCLGGPFGATPQAERVITGKTFQFLAAAAPVLVGKTGVSQLFKDRQNCLLVPQANAPALAEAIAWAADHPKELAAIAKAGRELYQQHFSQAIVGGLVAAIVKELM